MKRAICLLASALLVIATPWAYGQAGDRAKLQKKLNSSFKASKTFKVSDLASSFSDVVTLGDMLELHKSGLRMSPLSSSLTESNVYRNGIISGGSAKRAWATIGAAITESSEEYPPRTLAAGDRCWIEAILVQKDAILFKLFTDPDTRGMRYQAELRFPFVNKNQVPAADAALQLIAEVLTVVTPGQPASAPKPAPVAAAPPPPVSINPAPAASVNPAPAVSANQTPTIAIGQTRAQVIAAFGEPQRKAEAGTKEIFYYSDSKMKVTFINGIVSNID
jgi:hypothetical protein